MKTLNPDLVETLLTQVGTQFLTVDFITNSGETRTYNGLLRATSRLAGTERGARQSIAMRKRGQKWIAVAGGGSKSFYIDRVTGIRCKGAGIYVNASDSE